MRAQLSKALLSTLHYPVGGTKCCVNPNLILELVAGQQWPTMVNSGRRFCPFLWIFSSAVTQNFYQGHSFRFWSSPVPVLVKPKLCLSLFNYLFQPFLCPKGCSKQVLLELKVSSDLGQRGIDGSGHGMRATQKIWLQVWRVVHIGQQGLVTHCQKQCQMNHVITRRLKLAF